MSGRSGSRLFVRIEGPLVTKNQLRAQSELQRIRTKLVEDIIKYRWKKAARAKCAVSLHFFDKEKNKADISKLVKFYLDALKDVVFRDDRQVHYLEAAILRTPPGTDSSVIIGEVRRLSDYCRILDYAAEADNDPEEDERDCFPSLYPFDPRNWDVAKRQVEVLSCTQISSYDRPGMKHYLLPTMMERLKNAHPLIFELGNLSTDCGNARFLRSIKDILTAIKDELGLLSRIFVPIELDVQISNGCLQLAKDLDNIMLHVCREIGAALISESAYIGGYRAYVVDNLSRDSTTRVQVQLLPQGAIRHYSRRIEKAVEKYAEDLRDEQ
jgi:hypothetical protein